MAKAVKRFTLKEVVNLAKTEDGRGYAPVTISVYARNHGVKKVGNKYMYTMKDINKLIQMRKKRGDFKLPKAQSKVTTQVYYFDSSQPDVTPAVNQVSTPNEFIGKKPEGLFSRLVKWIGF